MIYNVRSSPYNAYGNGTNNDTAAILAAMNACRDAGGGEVYLPAGKYVVQNTIFNSINSSSTFKNSSVTVRGDAPNATSLFCDQNVQLTNPIFNVQGETGDGDRAAWFKLQDITLDGNNKSATWLNFYRASQVRLERVQILNTVGPGIYGEELWDSVFHDVLFDNVGVSGSPALELVSGPSTDANFSSNNIKLEACQFVNNPNISVQLGQDAHAIYFLGCSFTGSSGVSYATVKINATTLSTGSNSGICSFSGCRFLNCGSYHINALYADGMTGGAANGDPPTRGGNIRDTSSGGGGNSNSKNQGEAGAVL